MCTTLTFAMLVCDVGGVTTAPSIVISLICVALLVCVVGGVTTALSIVFLPMFLFHFHSVVVRTVVVNTKSLC